MNSVVMGLGGAAFGIAAGLGFIAPQIGQAGSAEARFTEYAEARGAADGAQLACVSAGVLASQDGPKNFSNMVELIGLMRAHGIAPATETDIGHRYDAAFRKASSEPCDRSAISTVQKRPDALREGLNELSSEG